MGTKLSYPGAAWIQGTINDVVGAVDLLLNPTDGNVGIGTTSPQDKLDVNGYVRANGSRLTSDIRWKENIEPLNDALDLVSQLRGVSYDWIDPSRGEGRQIGVIAQEVEQVFPEVVHTDSQGYKSVEYAKLVAPLIEAVKTLKAENDEMDTRIDSLVVENEVLKEENEAMQKNLQEILARLSALEK
jgi:FtsZ-binding cell division protein ZapB